MNRRSLFRKLGAAAAVVAVTPAMSVQAEASCTECELLRSRPVPVPEAFKPDPAMTDAVVELAHVTSLREGISHHAAAAMLYPRFFPSWTILPKFDPVLIEDGKPITFEEMQADCAARGCSLNEAPCLGSGYVITHGHPDVPAPWPSFDDHQVIHSPLTPTGLTAVNAWRRSLHDA